MAEPLSLTFAGGDLLQAGEMAPGDLSIAAGRVSGTRGPIVDARGYLILPGIIDLHGDGFERHLAPRRGAQLNVADGLPAVEAELASSGITTAMLAQFYSWEGGMRGPDFARRVASAVAGFDTRMDLRLQLRVEIGLREAFGDILALIDHTRIGYVVLNDHLPHDKLAQGKRPPRLTGQALKSGRSPEAHLALMQRLSSEMPLAEAALPGFTEALAARGCRIGSHDDPTPEIRARYRALGASIAEFPETRAAAEAAKAAGEPVIMGAPNVVRGNSHSGKVAATELIDAGLVDALVSDYHYAAIHRAALRLWDAGMPLAQAWALISSGPARIMGWTDRGRLLPGQRADLVVVDAQSRRIEATISAGHVTHLTGGFAARMVGAQRCG
ncbi:alpha-D-ribose 1-methylphosphonate 5-triphosphate diphosphatase [Gymnodinialimonas sp. 2305UL16-5]|uniref:alpha-D-ribose 1-methylphosphonate 5-triphosphate diphosphatase n=1 Tax=Gymnodinialimonas mytili TaxID=3126503 RepID=UPI00309D64EF